MKGILRIREKHSAVCHSCFTLLFFSVDFAPLLITEQSMVSKKPLIRKSNVIIQMNANINSIAILLVEFNFQTYPSFYHHLHCSNFWNQRGSCHQNHLFCIRNNKELFWIPDSLITHSGEFFLAGLSYLNSTESWDLATKLNLHLRRVQYKTLGYSAGSTPRLGGGGEVLCSAENCDPILD